MSSFFNHDIDYGKNNKSSMPANGNNARKASDNDGKNGDDFEQMSFLDVLRSLSGEDIWNAEMPEEDTSDFSQTERIKEEAEREAEANKEQFFTEQKHIEAVTSMDLPMDWVNFYDDDESTVDVHAESIPDAFIKCLNRRGCIDIEYISTISGEDYKTVIETLKGSIYQNPETWGECFFKGWETAEEYLSGNIRAKLVVAEENNKQYNGYFADNVKALKRVLPPMVSAKDIYVTLGSPWIPVDIIEDFIRYLTKDYRQSRISHRLYHVKHDEETGTWEFDWDYKSRYRMDYAFEHKYGTTRRGPFEILLKTLNMQTAVVMDTVKSSHTKSGKKSVINKNETLLAMEKQKLFIETFKGWVWLEKARKERLEKIYDEWFGSIKQRHYDGSFLELPGLNPDVTLFAYQKNAIARILFSANTLLAHDVGSGKTYIMIVAGMELKRLGMSERNLYVVPNNIIGQWKGLFKTLYPEANILCVEPGDFTPKKREEALEHIKESNYDAIIMAYSCFNQIPVSRESRVAELMKQQADLEKMASDYTRRTKTLEKRIDGIKDTIKEILSDISPEGICFDQLGITRLFVDEAHNFKNVPIESKIEHVMGISKTGSAKCQDMLSKVRIVQRANEGKGVVFATGTPITNSITDAYVMQLYLQSGDLAIMELQSFDSWVGMFAERTSNFEIDVDTSNYRLATRFAQFHNIPELTTMLAMVADFHSMDDAPGVPEHDGYQDVLIKKTAEFSEYLKLISQRAENVRHGRVSRTVDNMLKITTDGRKAALDLRLINDVDYRPTTYSKVFACAEKVTKIYKETLPGLSTQLVFCDTSTPKDGFNIYDELSSILQKMGVAKAEIAYIHDATTESKREKIFEDVRLGKIRVLIGSTFKLGLGVNVQDKLIAIHHLDVPWRPADMVQREGRILRQGNENSKVSIFRYITEGSFDAYSWQLLETKQRFITDLLSGTADERTGDEIDDTVLDYAQVKALAIGNPLIKERVEVANELTGLLILNQKAVSQRQLYEKELEELPGIIEQLRKLIPLTKEDADYYAGAKINYAPEERREIRLAVHRATHPEEPTKVEIKVSDYQGFEIFVPERVSKMHPVVSVRRAGRYSVELGVSDTGDLAKIDRCLDDLANRHSDQVKRLEELENKITFIKHELENSIDYIDRIDECKLRLAEIDDKLGVGKDK